MIMVTIVYDVDESSFRYSPVDENIIKSFMARDVEIFQR